MIKMLSVEKGIHLQQFCKADIMENVARNTVTKSHYQWCQTKEQCTKWWKIMNNSFCAALKEYIKALSFT
jgi:conjugal transfer/entry exclusion protein